MPIQFECPNCKTAYEVADDLAGKNIMCRGCQKRGAVRGLSSKPASGGGLATVAVATASPPTRRNFLKIGGWLLASAGAIVTGAVLARKPWRSWDYTTELRNPDMTTRSRGPRGPRRDRDDNDRKDDKEKKDAT
jgi:hypothetical protein